MALKGEKAQITTETLLVLGAAVVAAVTVGFFVKSFVSGQVAPQAEENLDK